MQFFKIKGVNGYFYQKIERSFHKITFFKDEGGYEHVCSVPAGNYGSPSIKPCGNPDGPRMLKERIAKFVKIDAKYIKFEGFAPSFWR